jgi:tripeptidyl-peptidase-1
MDRLAAVPQGWQHFRPASPDEPILLRVALKQQPQRVRALDQAVLEISTPGHPNYGLHMTRDELRTYTAPSEDTLSAITAWLRDHAIQPVVDHDWVSFTTTVRTANELLDTEFGWYQYLQDTRGPALRALSYSVPDHVAAHIDLVQPTTRFGNLGARKSAIFDMHPVELGGAVIPGPKAHSPLNSSDPCQSNINPECLRTLYNIRYKPAAPADNKVAFASFLEEYARYDDLDIFEKRFMPEAVGTNFSVELVNGGLNDQDSGDDSCKLLSFPVSQLFSACLYLSGPGLGCFPLRSIKSLTRNSRGQPRLPVHPRPQLPDSHGGVQRWRPWSPRPDGKPTQPTRHQRALP